PGTGSGVACAPGLIGLNDQPCGAVDCCTSGDGEGGVPGASCGVGFCVTCEGERPSPPDFGMFSAGGAVVGCAAIGFSMGLLSCWTSTSVPFSPGALSFSPLCSSLSAIFVRSLSPVRSFGPCCLLVPGVGFGSSWSCAVCVATLSSCT